MRFFKIGGQEILEKSVKSFLAAEGIVLFRDAFMDGIDDFLAKWTVPYRHPHDLDPGLTVIEPKMTRSQGENGFSNDYLPLHTDRATSRVPPSIVVLLMLRVPESGGEVIVLDGKEIANVLRRENIKERLVLKSGDAVSFPVCSVSNDLRLCCVRYRCDEVAKPVPLDPVARRALDAVNEVMEKNRQFPLGSGEGYITHNHRYLHGRRAFSGGRRVARFLANVDPESDFEWMNKGFRLASAEET